MEIFLFIIKNGTIIAIIGPTLIITVNAFKEVHMSLSSLKRAIYIKDDSLYFQAIIHLLLGIFHLLSGIIYLLFSSALKAMFDISNPGS